MAKNDYRALFTSGRFREVIRDLNAEGWQRPTMRACWYVLTDAREILLSENSYKKLNEVLSDLRDSGDFPYGLLSDREGTSYRGLLPDELKTYLEQFEAQNVPPILCRKILKVVMVEKVGLIDYIDQAVGSRVPVASPQGMVRKEWAVSWIQELKQLARRMGAERVEIIYIGDCDEYGAKIKAHEEGWFRSRGVAFDVWAVQPAQLRELNRKKGVARHELHADGYIVELGPKEFGRRLRKHLGLSERRGET